MKKRKFLLVFIVLVLIVAGIYCYKVAFYRDRFLPNSYVNNTDISSLTVAEAEKKLTKNTGSHTFNIVDNGVEWKKIPKEKLGVIYDYKSELQSNLIRQNNYLWPFTYTKKKPIKLQKSGIDNEKLQSVLSEIQTEITLLNEGRTMTEDAHLASVNGTFQIVPEVVGNSLNIEEFTKKLEQSLMDGEDFIELETFALQPQVLSNNEVLKGQLEHANAIAKQEVSYMINGNSVTVAPEMVSSWIEFDNNEVVLNREAVRAYVAQLGAQYNTSSNGSVFTSTRRGQVTVPAGTYGWTIQVDDETEALIEAILTTTAAGRTPITQGSASPDSPLIGNTYVEVDLAAQHMWFYKNGALVLETDVVTGKPSTPTPPGVFYIWSRERNSVLRGTNDDGSKYASPVSYWMPIDWTGVGIHDSDWQPAYGGELFKTVGSHGCINTPPSVAGQLFEAASVGVPVLVF